jgi:hypothetical protein
MTSHFEVTDGGRYSSGPSQSPAVRRPVTCGYCGGAWDGHRLQHMADCYILTGRLIEAQRKCHAQAILEAHKARPARKEHWLDQ